MQRMRSVYRTAIGGAATGLRHMLTVSGLTVSGLIIIGLIVSSGLSAFAQGGRGGNIGALRSLRAEAIPRSANLNQYVSDEQALIALEKHFLGYASRERRANCLRNLPLSRRRKPPGAKSVGQPQWFDTRCLLKSDDAAG